MDTKVKISIVDDEPEIRKILGEAAGSDDYISKPVRPDELLARIAAKLRRHSELQNRMISSVEKT